MRERSFLPLADLSATVIRAIGQMNKDSVLDRIEKLLSRWDSIIVKKGDYTEDS